MKIGVLAVQGGYDAHARALSQLSVQSFLVRSVEQLNACDGLIIPGGESSTFLKFILANGLFEKITEFYKQGKPLFGTCAGAILLAKHVLNPSQKSFGMVDIVVERNGYGRQLASEMVLGETHLTNAPQEMVFIRAPKIISFGEGVTILAHCRSEVVAVEEGRCLVTTFHPELTNNLIWHQRFLEMV